MTFLEEMKSCMCHLFCVVCFPSAVSPPPGLPSLAAAVSSCTQLFSITPQGLEDERLGETVALWAACGSLGSVCSSQVVCVCPFFGGRVIFVLSVVFVIHFSF